MVLDEMLGDLEVLEVPAAHRFEARAADGELVGVAEYQQMGDAIAFTHTEVPPEHGGHGVASRLVGASMDLVRESGRQVIAYCPYVRAWLTRHPEYQDLVARPRSRQAPRPEQTRA
ncbi:MAG: N-acetyltransferase [Micrococcales bacterium]|nr:N-acetyltransferase [Micrococcales bacterium]